MIDWEAILSKLSIEGIQIGTETLMSFEENAIRVCGEAVDLA